MIVFKDEFAVNAEFDTGRFESSFSVSGMPDEYDNYGTNIQEKYKLSFEDFDKLEIIISASIYKYLVDNNKIKE